VPGCYGFIGNGGVSHACEGLHSPLYDFTDEILGLGASFFARLPQRWFA